MSEASWKLAIHVLAKQKELKEGDYHLKWVWSERINKDLKVIIYDLSRGDALVFHWFCLIVLVKGHKWQMYGFILDLTRCPTSRVRVMIIISDQYHIYSLFRCVSVWPVIVLFFILLRLSFSSSKNLTWRDMQHLVVRTSHPNHLLTNDWRTNGVGRKGTAPSMFLVVLLNPVEVPLMNIKVQKALELVQLIESSCVLFSCSLIFKNLDLLFYNFPFFPAVSHSYGYGLLDASGIVELARTWSNVGPQRKCVIAMVCEPRLVHSFYAHTFCEISQKFTDLCVDTSNLTKIK